MKLTRFFAFLLVTSAAGIALGAPLDLRYSSQLPAEQRQLLEQDVAFFRGFPWKDNAEKSMSKVMGLRGVSPQSLEGWLAQRVRYIFDSSFKLEFKDENFSILRENVDFEVTSWPWIPGILPLPSETSNGLQSSGKAEKKGENTEDPVVLTTMSNIGSVIFFYGSMRQALLGLPIPGVGVVPISSGRVGVLQVGAGLFKTLSGTFGESNPLSTPFYRLRRIRALFHEARHSDGNSMGDSRGFMHETCPKDHDYAGYYACDVSSNGPYRIGSLITRSVIENCEKSGNCGVPQLEAFKLLMADDLSRIIDIENAPIFDPTPEAVKRVP
jgi:hypothetical protein